MEKLERELASLRARAKELAARHATAKAAFDEAKANLQHHHLEAELADDNRRAKLETTVASCALTRDGYADAFAVVQSRIVAAEQVLADERSALERQTASETLARDLDTIERVLPDYVAASQRLTGALDNINFHFESGAMARFVSNTTAQVEIAAGLALVELRAMVDAIQNGSAAIPPSKSELEPAAMIEAELQT